jgi:large subunit ribosomal protein L17
MRRFTEKLVTLAKKGTLASRRLVIARLDSIEAGDHLVDVVVPSIKRDSGYLRIVRAGFRKGDNTELATISFVDDITTPTTEKPAAKPAADTAKAPKKETK